MAKDYLAVLRDEPKDIKQHGIMGMRWGRRRTDAEIASSVKQRAASGDKVTPTAKAAAVVPHVSSSTPSTTDHTAGESSPARYARLAAQAKSGQASSMTETDLKFFNARTEALAKINKMNQTDPSWMSKTAKKVLQTTAERTLQSVTDAVAGKYISGPIIDSLKGSAAPKATSEPSKPKEPKLPKPNYVGFSNPNKK